MIEEFERIKNFEQEYLISNLGRVIRIYKDGQLKEKQPSKNHNGYCRVCLWKGNKRRVLRVHRLVAEHFIENDDPNFKLEVHHLNRDKSNNRIDNLEWCSHIKNMEWYHHGEDIEYDPGGVE